MLTTQLLFLVCGWFILSMIGLFAGGRRLKRTGSLLSAGWLAAILAAGNLGAFLWSGFQPAALLLSGAVFILGLYLARRLRDWNAFGQAAGTMMVAATLLFFAYLFSILLSASLPPLLLLLGFAVWFIELLAALLGLTHAFENLDVACRVRWPQRIRSIEPVPGYTPKVSVHVPAYNEPPELVAETLHALARLDYPDYEVLVVDNNTPEENTWRPIERLCQALGPRFRFLHLGRWPGYKSGALNFALSQTAPEAELVALVDADYRVEPDFLRETVSAFADPATAFLQTPQDYRDYEGDALGEALYYAYKYFFEVPMPVRQEHNAIIFGGTMGIIRKSVLQEIGGWDEWCITEDAEASLRILKRGYRGLYYNRSFGRGLMPLSFEGLKKQYFRWCFGGVQILKKHWEALTPWARLVEPDNRLTPTQRYFYLVGGLHWFTNMFNLWFTVLLLIVGILSLFSIEFAVRPLTGPLLVLPAVFWLLNVWRFSWVLRHSLRLSWRLALRAMYSLLSIGWTTTQAAYQGLVQPEGVFLRTPKTKGESGFRHALLVARWETGLGMLCLVTGGAVAAGASGLSSILLAVLLLWQASLYLSATVYSVLYEHGD